MINHIKVIGICILSLLLCSIETHAVRGSQITGDKVDIDLAQELASVGYDDAYVGEFTLPAYEILYRLEQNHIDSAQAYEELNILRQSLADYQTKMNNTFLGEGLDSRAVDADYLNGLRYLDSALEQLSLNVQSGSLTGNDLLLGSDGFGSELLPDIEYGYTASTEEVLELATWMPIVGAGAESLLCANNTDPSCIGSIASSTGGPAGKILIKGLDKAGNPIVQVVKKTGGKTKPLGSGGTAKEFEEKISSMKNHQEALPLIKQGLRQAAKNHGWKKNNKLTKMNNRDVYEGKDGNLYAFDTLHGRFEKLDKRGNHLGEVNIDLQPIPGKGPKPSHGIKVK